MRPLFSVELHLPPNDHYTDLELLIQEIASTVPLLDCDHTLLFLSSQADVHAVEAIIHPHNIPCEQGSWLALEDSWEADHRIMTDYGVITPAGHSYIDMSLCMVVQLAVVDDTSELELAVLQAAEHAIAARREDGRQLFAIDRQQEELLEGIARAYHCSCNRII
ncbi:hypothetical protein [Paenibacillus mendelii]|uniref:Uncharacterized protein n=1 Tax=Paenibacillus mendelii TaxID=206163 RepID=A0ABV6JIT1_9BACL|nr:hypothetical protein [Paenibacillus mendelii]MCQ6558287.1 hypothetical protein [Paenibacillus mendelii]